jgi:hypothetical protein
MPSLSCVVLCASLAIAGEVSFSVKPTAAKSGEKVKIAFVVSRETDVTVAIVDAGG